MGTNSQLPRLAPYRFLAQQPKQSRGHGDHFSSHFISSALMRQFHTNLPKSSKLRIAGYTWTLSQHESTPDKVVWRGIKTITNYPECGLGDFDHGRPFNCQLHDIVSGNLLHLFLCYPSILPLFVYKSCNTPL